MGNDGLAIRVGYPGEQVEDCSVSLRRVDLLRGRQGLRVPVRLGSLRQMRSTGPGLLGDGLSNMVPGAVHMMRQVIRIDLLGVLYASQLPSPRAQVEVPWQPTETIKIMAPFSRESSLQAVVSAGLPMGTNSKPGGGVFFVVT